MKSFLNIFVNALRRKNFAVMATKVLTRVKEGPARRKRDQINNWCWGQAESGDRFLASLDEKLWNETQQVCAGIEERGWARLHALGMDLGGGGNYPMLYFFTRYLGAKTVVETGVAAGWSSQAILTALEKNGQGGRLYSSDFPYFRFRNPEALVGYIVDEKFRKDWTLYIDGDRNNLPKIIAACGPVDLFHYDSDKSVEGRTYAWATLGPMLSSHALVIYDDIQDNFHFRDFVEREKIPFRVFEFRGKYVGVTGPAIARLNANAHAA